MPDEINPRICTRCGKEIPPGKKDCPRCDHRLELFLHSRETVLSGCALLIVILFFITEGVARGYHVKLHELAGQWFESGQKDLSEGNANAALADFRNALVYEPEDPRIQFRLTQALIADGRDEEARSYLLGMLARSPSDAPVNLALARIAASSGNETDALRYYHGAIYGVWPNDPETNRLNARLELSRMLIARGDDSDADGELIALEAEIPQQRGASLHEQAGELFLRAADVTRALEEFRRALAGPRVPVGALRGAGLTAYQMGDFRVAERYLDRAYREKHDDPEVGQALDTTRLILAWDPEARGLTYVQRRERARHDLEQAISRVKSCAASSGVDLSSTQMSQASDLAAEYVQAKSAQAGISDRNLERHPENLETAINLIFTMESTAGKTCGQTTGLDNALEILGERQQSREQ
jgi:tetratricopeptide (TPR) repeat protein